MSGFSTARQKMVDGQVRTNDVTDRRILDAMLTVPREAFVPAGRQALAYLDLDLDVSEGATKRFLIKPALTGKLLQAAEIGEGDNVLVVGCATGYLAALTAKLARQVVATECDSALAAKAKDASTALGLTNVTCKAAACTDGEPAAAPYDVIVLNGAAEVMPEALLGQLKEGGRLVGVSAESRPPRATIVTRTHGEFGHRALFDAAAPVLPGLERAAAFVF
ncbi:protein-L-isoaspartate O-methyltransferase family protein [Bradyrhizobium vignae]|uniref:Protein-L-isoaspartate O-methyltransferase n=1 Tax=Bradyrhizobium vignae TaxID=1549949 RepID=A0ABS4A2V8_9BRAD|nr:protein-L-isoaspartate O-methyltransferase [Bradyrhizobium vignae]MBP0114268.1 protein-L-isoaspartate O-methyltransferase [Bradyrhizobium vignae]RXH03998.1 protein-L-isoaspartate O-methyltransferase [Bradyrhizobium vignae]